MIPFSEYCCSSRCVPLAVEAMTFEDEEDDGGEAEDGGRPSNNCFKPSGGPELEMLDDDVTN